MPILVDDIFGLIIDDRLDHRDWRRIERRVHPAELSNRRFDLGNGRKRSILLLQYIQALSDGCVRHRRGHIQKRTFVQSRHEFLAETRKCMCRLRPYRIGLQPLRHEEKDPPKTHPDHAAKYNQQRRDRKKQNFVRQTPGQDLPVEFLEEPEEYQQPADQ